MSFDLLPQDEPGNPLPDTPPDFTDNLMKRIEADQRMRRGRRIATRMLVIVAVAAAAYLFAMRRIGDVPRVDLAHTHPRRVAPLTPSPVPAPVAPREAVKRETFETPETPVHRTTSPTPSPVPPVPQEAVRRDAPVPRTVSVRPQDVMVAVGIRPGDLKITVDGKEVRDEAELSAIIRSMDCTPRRVVLVRDGKPVTYIVHAPHEGDSRCTPAPAQ